MSGAPPLSGADDAFAEVLWDEAAEAAVEGASEEEAAEVEAARARAQALVGGLGGGLAGGEPATRPHEMALLAQAMGLPVPRTLFAEMVRAGGAPAGKKKKLLGRLEALAPHAETGCVSLQFRGPAGGAPLEAHLLLEKCGADHDLSAQLDPLYARTPPDQHDTLRQHLSMLVFLGRRAYRQALGALSREAAEMAKWLPAGFDPSDLRVDPANTTLHLPPPCTARVGLFVRYRAPEPGAQPGAAA